MKKISKIIILSIVLLILCGFCFYVVTYKAHNKMSFLTIPYDYYVESSEHTTFSVPIFSEQIDDPYLNKEGIYKAYLKSQDNSKQYKVLIDSIELKDDCEYNGKTYQMYNINIIIPFSESEDIYIDECYLVLGYQNEEAAFHIGRFCLYNPVINNTFSCSALKGVTVDMNDKTILSCVFIKINNPIEVKLLDITPISFKASLDGKNVQYLSNEQIDEYVETYKNINVLGSNTPISDNLNIKDGWLMIPLKYQDFTEAPQIGFILSYLENGVEKKKIIKPFCFFSSENLYQVEEMTYEYRNQ